MNKAELIIALADRLGMNKKATGEILDTTLDTIYRNVAKGDKVTITGFGTFEKVQRASRTGRNPATGESIKIKKSTAPKFRPGQEFKDVVSGQKKLGRLPKAAAPAAGPRGAKVAASRPATRASGDGAGAATAGSSSGPAKRTARQSNGSGETAAKKTSASGTSKRTSAASTAPTTTGAADTKTAAAKKLASSSSSGGTKRAAAKALASNSTDRPATKSATAAKKTTTKRAAKK